MKTLQDYIDKLNALNFKDMYENDFFLTWDKTDDELEAIWVLADAFAGVVLGIYMRHSPALEVVFESREWMLEKLETSAHLEVFRRKGQFSVCISENIVFVSAGANFVVHLRHQYVALYASVQYEIVLFLLLAVLCQGR